jgi:exodeoxyribonuclease VII large subunit
MENGYARLAHAKIKLEHGNPDDRVQIYKARIDTITYKLHTILRKTYNDKKDRFTTADALLTALNPVSILKRGYSITRTLPQKKILTAAASSTPGQLLDIQLAEGHIEAVVSKSTKR